MKRVDVHCGYLHRGFEKECEAHTWHNLIPYVDRLNYCSGLINNFALLRGGREADGRRDHAALPLPAHAALRVFAHRDHLTCIAASLMELGAMTAFLYLVMVRDYIYEHLAALTGARVTYTYGRIGGLARDLPAGWLARLGEILDQYEDFVGRVHGLMDRNRIFIDRTRNVGVISTADAINWGFTGPILRSTGVAARPAQGHALPRLRRARFRRPGRHQRRQLRPLLRAHAGDGRVGVHDPAADGDAARRARSTSTTGAARLPEKQLVYTEIESLINHFKLIMDGPAGARGRGLRLRTRRPTASSASTWSATAAARPYKVHVRSPSFVHMGGVAPHARGLPARRHHPDLRLGQHDRRGVRPMKRSMKHLIPEFDALRARFPAGFESSLVLPCLRRIQEDRATSPTSDIDGLVDYLGVPRIQIEEVLSFYGQFRRKPIGRWHIQACRNVSCSLLGAERIIDHLDEQARHRARGRPPPTAASRCRPSSAWPRAAPRRW